MVSGRPSRLWLCSTRKESDGANQKPHPALCIGARANDLPFRVDRQQIVEPQKIDLEFIEWLGENGIPFALVFTKSDKQSAGKTKQNVERFLDTLKEQWEELPPYFITSAEKKTGREEVLDYIDSINRTL